MTVTLLCYMLQLILTPGTYSGWIYADPHLYIDY
jgi:hypothetical protein